MATHAQRVHLSRNDQVAMGKAILNMLRQPSSGSEAEEDNEDVESEARRVEVEIKIKKTFIEIVPTTPSQKTLRRCQSDSALDEVRSAQDTTCPATPEPVDLSDTDATEEADHAWPAMPLPVEAQGAGQNSMYYNNEWHWCGGQGFDNSAFYNQWSWSAGGANEVYTPNMALPFDYSTEYYSLSEWLPHLSEYSAVQTGYQGGSNEVPRSKEPSAQRNSHEAGDNEAKTTVMLRNLPSDYTHDSLTDLLEELGLEGTFDFVYIPFDFSTQQCLGYAVVKFKTTWDAQNCGRWIAELAQESPSETNIEVVWSSLPQGVESRIGRHKNSLASHDKEEWKPAVYTNAKRGTFSAPAKVVKEPKYRPRC